MITAIGRLTQLIKWANSLQQRRAKSGAKVMNNNSKLLLDQLEAVLDRKSPINALHSLTTAINHKTISQKIDPSKTFESTAIGLDANVFLRLAKHAKVADIVDYLNTSHAAPLIIPGQAIQEFWNNQLSAVDTVSATLKKKFDALKQEAQKVDSNFEELSEEFQSWLSKFSDKYGHIYDEHTVRDTLKVLDFLQSKAITSYIPRLQFERIAANRKRTKTPPGFKDEGDGDFYVWTEFLFGLLQAKESGQSFQHAVLVTNDVKMDWSRDGVAHPILSAELHQLLGISFEVWNLDKLSGAIDRALNK
jgi:hypothetical protein